MKTHSLHKFLSKKSLNHFLNYLHYFLKVSLCIMILVSGSFIFTESLYCELSDMPDTGTGNISSVAGNISIGVGDMPTGTGNMSNVAGHMPTSAENDIYPTSIFGTARNSIPRKTQ